MRRYVSDSLILRLALRRKLGNVLERGNGGRNVERGGGDREIELLVGYSCTMRQQSSGEAHLRVPSL